MPERALIHLGRWGLLALILALWQWGWDLRAQAGVPLPEFLDPYYISKPSVIWQRFLELGCFTSSDGSGWIFRKSGAFRACIDAGQGSLWTHTMATLRNTFWGFFVGVGSGMATGLILGRSQLLARICEPYIVAINSLPRVALVPLIIIMFGLGDLSKVVTAPNLLFFFFVFFL